MSVSRALGQAWWAPLAALLIVGQVVIAVTFGFELDDDTESSIAGIAIALGGAAILAFGLCDRPQHLVRGDIAIVVGSLIAMVWFWSLVMPLLAIVVLVGLLITEIRHPRPARVT